MNKKSHDQGSNCIEDGNIFSELTRSSESFKVEEFLDTVESDYPKFHLSMDCFICSVVSGDLVLKEHEAAKWLTKDTLDSVDWLPADLGLIEKIREYLNKWPMKKRKQCI